MNEEREIEICAATLADLPAVKAMLEFAELPSDGVDDHLRTFVVARDDGRVIGCGGAETYSFAALLRSICVQPEYRGTGLGRRIVRQLLDRLASRGLREFYLLTTSSEEYFKKRGFRTIDRDEVHPQILASTQFRGACPETAICMRLVMH